MGGDNVFTILATLICLILLLSPPQLAQCQKLDDQFYDQSCPDLHMIVSSGVWSAITQEPRMAASLLRLHFHDCFVNGCDASVLLDDTTKMRGEKNAPPNRNSLRGFEVIESIKADVEKACPSTVSCADILTLAAVYAVSMWGSQMWSAPLGRRDGLSASEAGTKSLPSPLESFQDIKTKFLAQGLDTKDMVVLSGAHTIGYAQCFTFKARLFNYNGTKKPDPSLDPAFLSSLQSSCPNVNASNPKLVPLDYQTAYGFDNAYFTNLVGNKALLGSDQALMTDPQAAALVNQYSTDPGAFYMDFPGSMIKLGNIRVLTGKDGQIRKKCRSVN
ncbi:unnamed protein product [Cuscuta europaea]|uniref:Peroxidase n=1 Tax=Cuscuta europaea TaxID=41803 RepID=A0A9P1E683_CUSEU|nr:unnamed protein product [Cuscuta europaea]